MRIDIVIIGAGIGGLATAAALGRAGYRVRLVERAGALKPVGAGIQISPNGLAVLRALGLQSELETRSLENRAVVLMNGLTGREVLRMDVTGRGFRLFHRADLVDMLAGAARLAGVRIDLGQGVESVTDGLPAAVTFDTDTDIEAPFVLGADGVRSVVRSALVGEERPLFTRQVAWRSVIDGQAAAEARVEMGPGRHLVSYPLTNGRVNLVGVEERRDWAAEGWHTSGDPADFRAAFAAFPAAAARLERVDRVNLWGLFRHPVARRWHGQSLAILGDAAHPTLPFLAQGANLALEDAWTFARAFARDDRDRALAEWSAARRPRVVRAIRAANRNARNYHLSGPVRQAALVALGGMNRLGPAWPLKGLDWLYGADVTAN